MARMGEGRGVHRVLVGKPEGKGPVGRRRWEDNFKMDLKGVDAGWSWLRIGTGVGTCEYGDETSCSIKCGEFLD